MIGDTQLLDFAHFFDNSGEEGSDWVVVVGSEQMSGFGRVGCEEESEGGGFKNGVRFEAGSAGKCMEIAYMGFRGSGFYGSGE